MKTQEIADRLYELSQENKWDQAQDELFAENAKSIEPPHAQGQVVTEGLSNIKQKGTQFRSMVEEMYGGWVKEPQVYGNYIAMEMGMDVKMKGAPRMKMGEMCIYECKDGKIISEQFFF